DLRGREKKIGPVIYLLHSIGHDIGKFHVDSIIASDGNEAQDYFLPIQSYYIRLFDDRDYSYPLNRIFIRPLGAKKSDHSQSDHYRNWWLNQRTFSHVAGTIVLLD